MASSRKKYIIVIYESNGEYYIDDMIYFSLEEAKRVGQNIKEDLFHNIEFKIYELGKGVS